MANHPNRKHWTALSDKVRCIRPLDRTSIVKVQRKNKLPAKMKCLLSIIFGVLLLEISIADIPTTITVLDGDYGSDQLIFAHVVSEGVVIELLNI